MAHEVYVAVPVRVIMEGNEVVSVDAPDRNDVLASLNGIGGVQNKDKLMGLLKKFGPLAKSFIKTL